MTQNQWGEPMVEFVCGFMFSTDLKHVLLIRKARPNWQAGRLNGVGGHLEDCEGVYESMEREFTEETGYAGVQQWQHRVILTVNHNAVVHFFSAITDLDTEFALMKGSLDEPLVKFPMSDCVKSQGEMVQSLSWLLPYCADQCVVGASSTELDYSSAPHIPIRVAYKNHLIPR